MASVIAVILGGGRGTRLFPLTRHRAKPSVPIAGKFRLIDIPMSNCIHSGIEDVYILTQFNSASLNHHVSSTYQFSSLSARMVRILAAMQTPTSERWFQGTADAVRQNLRHLVDTPHHPPENVLILAGDHLYRMNYRDLVEQHQETEADITVGVVPVSPHDAPRFGILRANGDAQITDFVEKPQEPEQFAGFESTIPWRGGESREQGERLLGSMGIYVFRTEVLMEALENPDNDDFGHDIIPNSIASGKVFAYPFSGYWEDIGTIRSFYEANLGLLDTVPAFDFYNEAAPVYTFRCHLANTKVNESHIRQSMLAEGSIIDRSEVHRSIIGLRSHVRDGSRIDASLIMGSDYYESAEEIAANAEKGVPAMGIGRGCTIAGAIIDKNAYIGDGAVLVNEAQVVEVDMENYCIRDRIIVVPKGAVIPPGTVI